jgi:hypothetical protein
MKCLNQVAHITQTASTERLRNQLCISISSCACLCFELLAPPVASRRLNANPVRVLIGETISTVVAKVVAYQYIIPIA